MSCTRGENLTWSKLFSYTHFKKGEKGKELNDTQDTLFILWTLNRFYLFIILYIINQIHQLYKEFKKIICAYKNKLNIAKSVKDNLRINSLHPSG